MVGKALVAITNDLEDFARSSWVVTAYLLTYTGTRMLQALCLDTPLLTVVDLQGVWSSGLDLVTCWDESLLSSLPSSFLPPSREHVEAREQWFNCESYEQGNCQPAFSCFRLTFVGLSFVYCRALVDRASTVSQLQ